MRWLRRGLLFPPVETAGALLAPLPWSPADIHKQLMANPTVASNGGKVAQPRDMRLRVSDPPMAPLERGLLFNPLTEYETTAMLKPSQAVDNLKRPT